MEYTVRTAVEEDLVLMQEGITRCVQAAALATGCTVSAQIGCTDSTIHRLYGEYRDRVYRQHYPLAACMMSTGIGCTGGTSHWLYGEYTYKVYRQH